MGRAGGAPRTVREALQAGTTSKEKGPPVADGVLAATPESPEVDWRSRSPLDVPSSSFLDDEDEGPRPHELYGKFTWRIENFSEISKRELRSHVFEVGSYKWYILVYPQGCDVCNHLSLFLCVADYEKLLPGWSHFAQFTIAVVHKDAKKSKYSDTLHRFCKKEHDWGWKKFMELSKVLDGFTQNDTLTIRAQVQVILDRPGRPFCCLNPVYRRELVRVYLSNVEGVCRRFCEEKRQCLAWVREDPQRFREFWASKAADQQRKLISERGEVVLKGVVKQFFNEKEVTSTLVMDALFCGCKQLDEQSRSFLEGKPVDSEPLVLVRPERNLFMLNGDLSVLVEQACQDFIPPTKDDGKASSSNEGLALRSGQDEGGGGDASGWRDSMERDEQRLAELGRRTVEMYVISHVCSEKLEVAFREVEALRRQDQLIAEEFELQQLEDSRRKEQAEKDKEKRAKKKERVKAKKEVEKARRDAEDAERRRTDEQRQLEAERKAQELQAAERRRLAEAALALQHQAAAQQQQQASRPALASPSRPSASATADGAGDPTAASPSAIHKAAGTATSPASTSPASHVLPPPAVVVSGKSATPPQPAGRPQPPQPDPQGGVAVAVRRGSFDAWLPPEQPAPPCPESPPSSVTPAAANAGSCPNGLPASTQLQQHHVSRAGPSASPGSSSLAPAAPRAAWAPMPSWAGGASSDEANGSAVAARAQQQQQVVADVGEDDDGGDQDWSVASASASGDGRQHTQQQAWRAAGGGGGGNGAAAAALQAQVKSLRAQVAGLLGQLANRNAQVVTLRGQVADLTQALEQSRQQQAALQLQLKQAQAPLPAAPLPVATASVRSSGSCHSSSSSLGRDTLAELTAALAVAGGGTSEPPGVAAAQQQQMAAQANGGGPPSGVVPPQLRAADVVVGKRPLGGGAAAPTGNGAASTYAHRVGGGAAWAAAAAAPPSGGVPEPAVAAAVGEGLLRMQSVGLSSHHVSLQASGRHSSAQELAALAAKVLAGNGAAGSSTAQPGAGEAQSYRNAAAGVIALAVVPVAVAAPAGAASAASAPAGSQNGSSCAATGLAAPGSSASTTSSIVSKSSLDLSAVEMLSAAAAPAPPSLVASPSGGGGAAATALASPSVAGGHAGASKGAAGARNLNPGASEFKGSAGSGAQRASQGSGASAAGVGAGPAALVGAGGGASGPGSGAAARGVASFAGNLGNGATVAEAAASGVQQQQSSPAGTPTAQLPTVSTPPRAAVMPLDSPGLDDFAHMGIITDLLGNE